MIQKAVSTLDRISRPRIITLSLVLIFIIGTVDYKTGLELHLTFFYLFPIGLASWFGNQRVGVSIAVLCSIAWFVANRAGGLEYSSDLVALWNFIMRVGVSLVIAYTLSCLRIKMIEVSDLARRDFLTGLPNGRAFYELAAGEMERAFGLEPLTLACIDMEGFKWINHRLGYATGDQMLCTIAQAIKESVPRPDLIGRIGGTSFAVLLPNTTSEGANYVLENVQKKLKEERRRYAQPVTFFISAIACSKAPRSVAELMHEAELRMTRMKSGSKDIIEIAQVDSVPALN
jgi:diguanylate cyclase (GGDEF)-like protein